MSKFFGLLKQCLIAFFLLTLMLLARTASACVCMAPSTPYKEFQDARSVFTGKIIGSTDVPFTEQAREKTYTYYERRYRVAVTESFKGTKAAEVEVSAGRTDSDCYVGFSVGENYLIYAYGDSDAKLSTGMCTRTNNLSASQDDLHYLRAMLMGEREPRVYGSVVRFDDDVTKSLAGSYTPLEGIKIAVEGEGQRIEVVTDKQGLFQIAKLPDGKYRARPVLPGSYASSWPGEEEFILGLHAQPDSLSTQIGSSAYAKFHVRWNNQLSGKILDAEGNLIKRARVSVLAPRGGHDSPLVIREDPSNYHPDGAYGFSGLTPGKYILSLSLRAPLPTYKPTRFYYPTTTSLDQAREISVGENENLTVDLKLPTGYAVRPVEGVVVWPDDSSVGDDGWVFLADAQSSEDDDKKYDWTSTDKQGRFSLQGFEGAEYWLHASVRTRGLRTTDGKELWDTGPQWLRAQPVRVKVGRPGEPLRIVVLLPEGVIKRDE